MVLILVFPMIIQRGVTNFVSLLDNIMVGKLGTEQVAGVAIANQLIFVFNLCIFGAVSGAGIFTAQYFGSKNLNGVRNTFQLKLIINTCITLIGIGIFLVYGDTLIRQYLLGDTKCGDVDLAFHFGKNYILIMMIGLLPFAWSQSISSTLRECGETVSPMIASIAAVATNFVLNLLLIFGFLGAPKLGSNGAAIATVVSRFVELGVLTSWVCMHKANMEFFRGVFTNVHIPFTLLRNVVITGSPLVVNETLWASAQAFMNRLYSSRGIEVITALSISSTISNLFYVVYFALGESIAIVVGQKLGEKDMDGAKDTAYKMIFLSVVNCLIVGLLMVFIAPLFPKFYNTQPEVKEIARNLIFIAGVFMPIYAYEHATYFTMRSGGKTIITFLFDSVFVWVVNVPTVFILSQFTDFPIVPLYLLCQFVEFIKCGIGYVLVKKGVWLQNIVDKK